MRGFTTCGWIHRRPLHGIVRVQGVVSSPCQVSHCQDTKISAGTNRICRRDRTSTTPGYDAGLCRGGRTWGCSPDCGLSQSRQVHRLTDSQPSRFFHLTRASILSTLDTVLSSLQTRGSLTNDHFLPSSTQKSVLHPSTTWRVQLHHPKASAGPHRNSTGTRTGVKSRGSTSKRTKGLESFEKLCEKSTPLTHREFVLSIPYFGCPYLWNLQPAVKLIGLQESAVRSPVQALGIPEIRDERSLAICVFQKQRTQRSGQGQPHLFEHQTGSRQ